MTVRDMKWHIIGPGDSPLCWGDKALEFNTEEDARDFLASVIAEEQPEDGFYECAIVKEGVLYYDGGYLNVTNCRIGWDDENCEIILVNK